MWRWRIAGAKCVRFARAFDCSQMTLNFLGEAQAQENRADYSAAMTSISTRASLGRRATWTVERAGGAAVKNFP